MSKIWLKILTRFSILKNQFIFYPYKNLVIMGVVLVISAPVTYVVSKETATKFYTNLADKDKVLVSDKVRVLTKDLLPEVSGDIATDTSSNQSTSGSSKESSSISSSSSGNGSSGSSSSGSSGSGSSSGDSGSGSGTSGSGSSSSSTDLASCGSNYSFFTTSPLNQSDFKGLTPLGNLNPSGHVFPTDHIYFYLTNPLASYNLYAPGNATITQINASEHVEDGFTDYSFTFQPCNEFKAQFGHVATLADKLSQALTAPYSWESTYSTGGKTYHMYGKMVNLTISAGEQIGIVGGNPGQYALDMNAYDTRVTLNFANSSRWSQRSDTTHTVCPINYYWGDLKNTLINRFGDYDGDPKRTIEPICGTIEQDIAGTAQGVWFVAGTTTFSSEDPHLALVHDNIDPNKPIFSVGTSMSASGLSTGTYEYLPQSSGLVNRDFASITSDGNTYCFDPIYLSGSKIILQMDSSSTIKLEKQSGSCGSGPWSFTSNATEFER